MLAYNNAEALELLRGGEGKGVSYKNPLNNTKNMKINTQQILKKYVCKIPQPFLSYLRNGL